MFTKNKQIVETFTHFIVYCLKYSSKFKYCIKEIVLNLISLPNGFLSNGK